MKNKRCERCKSLVQFVWAITVHGFTYWVCDDCLTVNERKEREG